MPTYDYQCQKCGNIQEEFHSISQSPEIKCKECNELCKKIFAGSTNFILKGDGFPSTSYKIKRSMSEKNKKMGSRMTERKMAGEGVSNIGDLKKIK